MADMVQSLVGSVGALALGAATATAAYYYMANDDVPQFYYDMKLQTVPVDGQPHVRISQLCTDGKPIATRKPDVTTLYEVFQRGRKVSEDGPCLGSRNQDGGPYHWLSYTEVIETSKHLGAGFIENGQTPVNTTRIGIYCRNRNEFVLTQLACFTYSMVVIPLYDTLGPEACTYIIDQANISLIIADTAEKISSILKNIDKIQSLKTIVYVEEPLDTDREVASNRGINLIHFDDIIETGKNNPHELVLPTAKDLHMICYTSGTTGMPKGAMLSHRSSVACVEGLAFQLQHEHVGRGDVLASYLPLAHVYEQMVEMYAFVNGAGVAFSRGNIKLLTEDLMEMKPTIFPTVPRLLNRIYDKVLASVSQSSFKKALLSVAVAQKSKQVQRGVIRNDTIWDSLVFGKIQKLLGGRCRVVVSGSAPLSPRVLNFVRAAFGCQVLEGYGQTECSAVSNLQLNYETTTGNVGPGTPACMIKLADVPDMNYYSKDMKGEVCIKGPIVFDGYLNQPDKTAEALDEDGWLHTGDIGMWTENFALKLIDRKKHIFKLAQGEYIAPEKIENVYIRSEAIAQAYVYGNSLKSCVIGVMVPDPETFGRWCHNKLGSNGLGVSELCKKMEVKRLVLEEVQKIGKSAGLHSFEQVKDIILEPEMWTVENNKLTPTFKTKRTELEKTYKPRMDKIYERMD